MLLRGLFGSVLEAACSRHSYRQRSGGSAPFYSHYEKKQQTKMGINGVSEQGFATVELVILAGVFSFSSPPSRPVSAVPSRRVCTTWLLPANEPTFPWVSLSLPSPGHKLKLVCPKCLGGHPPRHQTHCSPWGEASEDQEHSATTVTGTERELQW